MYGRKQSCCGSKMPDHDSRKTQGQSNDEAPGCRDSKMPGHNGHNGHHGHKKSNRRSPHGKILGTTTVGERGQVVIPAEARAEMEIASGDKLIVFGNAHNGSITLVKADIFDRYAEFFLSKSRKLERLAEEILSARGNEIEEDYEDEDFDDEAFVSVDDLEEEGSSAFGSSLEEESPLKEETSLEADASAHEAASGEDFLRAKREKLSSDDA